MSSHSQIQRQTQVEQRFFRPEKTQDPNWFHHDQATRLRSSFRRSREESDSSPIAITSLPSRAIIIADVDATGQQIEGLQQRHRGNLFNRFGYPEESFFNPTHQTTYRDYPVHWSSEECVRASSVGGTAYDVTYAQRANPHQNHKGDCRVDFAHNPNAPSFLSSHRIGSYPSILTKLDQIAPDRERQIAIVRLLFKSHTVYRDLSANALAQSPCLASCNRGELEWMHWISRSRLPEGSTATNDEFTSLIARLGAASFEHREHLRRTIASHNHPDNVFCPITSRDLLFAGVEPTDENVQFLNDLRYLLLIKEVARRQRPEDPNVDLPYATCLIRALKLVGSVIEINGENQWISLRTVLDPEIGLLFFTKPAFLLGQNLEESRRKIQRLNQIYEWVFPFGSWDRSGKAMMRELKRHYGGAADSDSDEYG